MPNTISKNELFAITKVSGPSKMSGCLERKDGKRCGDNVVKEGRCVFHLNERAAQRQRWGGYKSQLVSLVPAFDEAIKKERKEQEEKTLAAMEKILNAFGGQ